MDLICKVDGINLNIKWFYSTLPNAENSSIPLQNVTNQYFIQHDFVYVVNDSVHTATRSRLRVKNASTGYYWCRIYRNNVPLWPVSLKMDLSEPQYYSRYGSCTSDQADMINKCYYVTMPSAATSTTSVNPPGSTAAGVLQLQTTATQPSLLGLSTQHQRYTSSSYPMPSSSVTGRLAADVPNCNEYQPSVAVCCDCADSDICCTHCGSLCHLCLVMRPEVPYNFHCLCERFFNAN